MPSLQFSQLAPLNNDPPETIQAKILYVLCQMAGIQTTAAASSQTSAFGGNVGGFTYVPQVIPAITAGSAYAAGNNIGGLLTYANALRTPRQSGILENVTIMDRGNQKSAMDLLIFKAPPGGAFTDKSAYTPVTGDDALLIGRVTIAAADWVTYGSKALVTEAALGIAISSTGPNLYCALISQGTPTYATTTDLVINLGILQD